MGIDVSRARLQANQLNNIKDEFSNIANKISLIKQDLNNSWQAEEMVYINNCVEQIDERFKLIARAMDQLGSDIVVTAEEIRREEESRRRSKKKK